MLMIPEVAGLESQAELDCRTSPAEGINSAAADPRSTVSNLALYSH